MKRTLLLRASRLTTGMTLRQFDHGYWYATEIKKFARSLGVPAAHKLRKDELEKIIRHFLTHGRITSLPKRDLSRSGIKDVDRGLRLDRRVVLYTNDRETKAFLEREARKMEPTFRRRSGARYRLNRWREAQLLRGVRITYRDLVKEYVRLNRAETTFRRGPSGRYINFISDFVAGNPAAGMAAAIRAWKTVKRMDSPKDYRGFANSAARTPRGRRQP
jgi:SAP domain-containing protein